MGSVRLGSSATVPHRTGSAILPLVRITAIRLRASASSRSTRPFPAAWDPVPRRSSRPRSSGSRPTRASSASARATRWTASRRSSTCSSARTRWPSPATSGRSRPSTSTPAATGRSRSPCGTSSARSRGCRSRRCSVAPRTGSRRTPRAACCCRPRRAPSRPLRLREEGFRALKIRVDPRRLDEGLAAVAATRAAVGDTMAIMVDLNQGWRMAGDVRRRSTRSAPAGSPPSSPSYGVLWVEEPLAGTDLRGLAALRASAPGVRIAGGEMTRTFAERWPPLDADAFDVYQPDVVLAAGMLRTRTLGELALARNRWFTPHTWTNGIGAAGQPPRGGRRGWRPVPRVPVRPAGLDRRSGATPCSPSRSARTATGCCACRRRRASASSSTRPPIRAVRGMTPDAPAVDARRLAGAGRRARAAARAVHRWAVRPGRLRPDLRGRHRSRRLDRSPRSRRAATEDVDAAVAAARRSFDDRRWADQPPANRKRVLLRSAELIRANREELALLESLDVGKPIRDTLRGRRPVGGQDHPVVRRDDRQGLRRDRPDRAGRPVARDPRADRRGRGDRALELPADHHAPGSWAPRWRPATPSSSSRPPSRR